MRQSLSKVYESGGPKDSALKQRQLVAVPAAPIDISLEDSGAQRESLPRVEIAAVPQVLAAKDRALVPMSFLRPSQIGRIGFDSPHSPNTLDERPGEQWTEQFVLLAGRIARSTDRGSKCELLVTSSLPQEGKSFVASNLATALAKAGSQVLLVDAHLQQPTLTTTLGLHKEHGLRSLLQDKIRLEDIIYATTIATLKFVSAGTPSNDGNGKYAPQRLLDCLERLSSMCSSGYLIVEAPPILTGVDAREMSASFRSIVLVIAADRTRRSLTKKALRLLSIDKPHAVVLNRFHQSFSSARANHSHDWRVRGNS